MRVLQRVAGVHYYNSIDDHCASVKNKAKKVAFSEIISQVVCPPRLSANSLNSLISRKPVISLIKSMRTDSLHDAGASLSLRSFGLEGECKSISILTPIMYACPTVCPRLSRDDTICRGRFGSSRFCLR